MCVIIYKPKGQDLPSDTILKNCFSRNPHGAGFMFHTKNKVHIRKGFMDYNTFESALNDIKAKYDTRKMAMVLHFRITTQGGTNQACTHPFPLSSKMNDLRLLSCQSDIGIAHNGIISLTTTYTQVDYSDTMKFITDYLSLIITKREYYKSKKKMTLIERLVGSKLAIMDGDGHVELIGNFIEDDGIFYSNDSYKEPKKVVTTTYGGYNGCYSSKYNTYNYNDDYWERFRSAIDDEYDFDESYCPLSIDGDNGYCYWCANYNKCKLVKQQNDDVDTSKLDTFVGLENTSQYYYIGEDELHVIAYDSENNMYDVMYIWEYGEWVLCESDLIEESEKESEDDTNE